MSNNVTGEIYRITVTTKTAIAASPGPPSGQNDGARCASAPIPTITVAKTVGGRVQTADQFTVGLKNSGGTTVTSATTAGTATTASTTNWPVAQGATYTITDGMAAGSPDPLGDYVPTIACTDTTTGAPVTPGGSAPNWTVPVTTTDALRCVVTNTPAPVGLAVAKTSSPNPYVAGTPLTYTVTVTNAGPAAAVNASVSDPLPAPLQGAGFTWTCAASSGATCATSGSGNITDTVTIPAGGQLVYTVAGTVPLGTTAELTNTATVTPNPHQSDTGCTPSCSATNQNPPQTVDLAVKKAATPNPYVPGTPLTYTVTVTNAGPATATGATVSDPLPATLAGAGFTWTCVASAGSTCAASGSGNITDSVTIPAGGKVTYTVTGTVPSTVEGTLTNTATITPPSGDNDPGCTPNCASTVTDPPHPTVDLAVTKTATPDPYVAGQPLTYTVTVTNAGPSEAIGASVSDPLPAALQGAGFTWTCAPSAGASCATTGSGNISDTVTIPVGGQLVYTVTGTVPTGTTATLTNTATVTPPPGSSDTGCTPNCSGTNHDPPATVDLKVTKTSTPDPYMAGQVLTWTITVTNGGPDTATGATVSDPLPGGLTAAGFTWTCTPSTGATCTTTGSGNITDTVTIPSGGHLVYAVTGTVPAGTTGALDNTVTVTPPNGYVDTGCTPNCSTTNLNPPQVKLSATKTSTPNPYVQGEPLTYTVIVKNTGPSQATGAKVTDPLPTALQGAGFTWTCTPSAGATCAAKGAGNITDTVTIAAGGQVAYTVTGTVPLTTTATLTNTVTVTPPPGDVDTGCTPNCGATNTDPPITPQPAMSVVKHAGTPVDANHDGVIGDAGDTIAYTFTVTDTGNVPMMKVAVNDSKVGAVSCPQASLLPAGTETCATTSPYTITAADVTAGSVANTATATGTDPQGTVVTSAASTVTTPTKPAPAAPATTTPSSPPSSHVVPLASIPTGHGWWSPGSPGGWLLALLGGVLVVGTIGVVGLQARRRRRLSGDAE